MVSPFDDFFFDEFSFRSLSLLVAVVFSIFVPRERTNKTNPHPAVDLYYRVFVILSSTEYSKYFSFILLFVPSSQASKLASKQEHPRISYKNIVYQST